MQLCNIFDPETLAETVESDPLCIIDLFMQPISYKLFYRQLTEFSFAKQKIMSNNNSKKMFFFIFQADSKICEEAPSFQDTDQLLYDLTSEVCLGNLQWVEINSYASMFPLNIPLVNFHMVSTLVTIQNYFSQWVQLSLTL